MRHFSLLSFIISGFAFMNAYATPDVTPSTSDATANKTAIATSLAQTDKLSTEPLAPVATSFHTTLNLKQEGQRLYAYVIIDQPQNNKGKIHIVWTPPAHSSCDKSSYTLSYQGKTFHTRAYRTLGYSLISGKSISCTGTWHASVKNELGKVLTTTSINIESVDSFANNTAKMHSLAAIA